MNHKRIDAHPRKDNEGNYGVVHNSDVEWVRQLLVDIEVARNRYGIKIVFGDNNNLMVQR